MGWILLLIGSFIFAFYLSFLAQALFIVVATFLSHTFQRKKSYKFKFSLTFAIITLKGLLLGNLIAFIVGLF